MYNILILSMSVLFILISSMLFCNALEHLGERLGVSEGVTGSLFAAIGTALPETIVPLISLLSIHSADHLNQEVGIGAILGAPMMLSTLSLCFMALSIIRTRGINGYISPEPRGLQRDLLFFLSGFMMAILAMLLQKTIYHAYWNILIVIILAINYFFYVMLTIKDSIVLPDGINITQATQKLAVNYLGLNSNNIWCVLQLILSIMMMIYFAGLLIDNIHNITNIFHISPFILSLIIIPIATEMPEKINSIIWIRKRKDTLAVSNITGAMVFQGSLLPIMGILFTDWSINNSLHIVPLIVTVCATLWLYLIRKNIKVWHLLVNGLFYIVFLSILKVLS